LFAILSTTAWPQIRQGLDAREQAIAHDKAEAVKAKREADALRAGLAGEKQKAADEVRQMMDKARADAQATAAEELARGKADLAAEKERLHRDVAREREQLLAEVYEQGAGLAALLSAKAIGKNLTEADHRALLAQALDEFRGATAGLKQGAKA
ncbi:MAG: ATP synthase F0 subunit B, partial [Gemmataceae bacterium]|nr:ATP synthase F0 subunit B [Gemmataceae bacterium]